ncbi:hypothetical protein HK096_001619, partial [Nowakowskiella sp. JEL0078]
MAGDPEFGHLTAVKELWKLTDEGACKLYDEHKVSKSTTQALLKKADFLIFDEEME